MYKRRLRSFIKNDCGGKCNKRQATHQLVRTLQFVSAPLLLTKKAKIVKEFPGLWRLLLDQHPSLHAVSLCDDKTLFQATNEHKTSDSLTPRNIKIRVSFFGYTRTEIIEEYEIYSIKKAVVVDDDWVFVSAQEAKRLREMGWYEAMNPPEPRHYQESFLRCFNKSPKLHVLCDSLAKQGMLLIVGCDVIYDFI